MKIIKKYATEKEGQLEFLNDYLKNQIKKIYMKNKENR